MAEQIIEKGAYEQYKLDMQRYTIYVSRKRITPEYRDGLKPIHRRILYTMWNDSKCITNTVKSANVVGTVIGKYSPHGDEAAYGAIKPMANWFEINMPLIEGQGNFGNFDGDKAAAKRYTEVKLSKFAMECVIGELAIDRNVVNWSPNYDGSTIEPDFLPAAVPLLLINGSYGIGVGMKVEIPRHNLSEVIDVTLTLMDDPNAKFELIPDHSMQCEIFKTDFRSIANKGFGHYKVRGKIDIEEENGHYLLVIKSLPDLTFFDTVKEKIDELIEKNKIIHIQEYRKETTTKGGMREVFVLKKGADPNFVRDVIYKNTPMESSERVNFEVLDGINPMRMSYRSYLLAFIDFRKLTKFRLYCNKLQTVKTKIHERDAYIKVLESGEIDNIIKMIRNRVDTDDTELIEYLITKVGITDLQAEFIINCNLKKLSKGYLAKYKEDAAALKVIEDECMNKILYEEELVKEIKEELLMYKQKYGRPRNCKVINPKDESDIPKGEFKIIVTDNNFIKKVLVTDSIGSLKGDSPKRVIKVENTENILIFDEKGKVFKLPVHRIPFTEKNSNGTDIRFLIKGLTANIHAVIYEPIVKELADRVSKFYMVIVTANGNIKKLDLADFLTVPPSGIIYIKLDDDDVVKDVMMINENTDVIVYSDKQALRMTCASIPHLKRSTKGSRCMVMKEKIDGMSIITNNTTDIVVITEKGYVNRFSCVGMPCGERGGKGASVIKLTKNDSINCIYGLNVSDSIRVITKNGRLDINVSELEKGSSVSTGNKVIPLKGDSIIRCDIVKNK